MEAQDSLFEEVLEAKSQLVVVSRRHLLPLCHLRQKHQRHLQRTLFKGRECDPQHTSIHYLRKRM